MKKGELKKLIREILKEQASPDAGLIKNKLSQLRTAIDKYDPRAQGRPSPESRNDLFKFIDRILCWLDRDCEWNDGDPDWGPPP